MQAKFVFRSSIVAIAALACLAARLAQGVDANTTQIVIEPILDVPFLANHYFESDAVLADGSFALSGTTTVVPPGTDGYPQFEVQTYAPDGSLRGIPFVPEAGHPVDTGGVVPLGDHYFVSWQHFLAKSTVATFVGPQGEPLTNAFLWPNSDIEAYHAYYRHGGPASYDYLPVMYHQDGLDPSGDPIRQPTLRVYGADARPLGPPVVLSLKPSRIYIDDIAMNGEGRFVVLYQRCAKTFVPPRPCAEGAQIFSGAGQAQTPFVSQAVVPILSAQETLRGSLTVGIAPDGKFLVLWAIETGSHVTQLFARLFDRQALPLSGSLLIAEAPLPGFVEEHVIGLADGSFALSWAVAGDPGVFSIYVSRFNPFTLQASPQMLIATDRLAAEDHHLALNDSGSGIVTWATYHPENPDNVFAGHLRLIRFPPYRVPKQAPPVKQRP